MVEKRKIDLVVISDSHLGTYGAKAKELTKYLRSIDPKVLVLNGDIIDGWYFSKSYFPKSHMAVVQELTKFAASGKPLYYLTGNHDEFLRRFSPMRMGNVLLDDKVLLTLNNKKIWIFHGDVFDGSITHSKWLAKLGGWGYNLLILLNWCVNWALVKMGKQKRSLSKAVKDKVKRAVNKVSNFEDAAAELAIENGYDYVICGHIHKPQMREVKSEFGSVMYLNSGDWIENLSSLEYNDGKWRMYLYREADYKDLPEEENAFPSYEDLIKNVVDDGTGVDATLIKRFMEN